MSVTYHGSKWLQPVFEKMQLHWGDRVTELLIRGEHYTDAVVDDICVFRHLEQLTLQGTMLSPDGLRQLRSRLPNCRITFD